MSEIMMLEGLFSGPNWPRRRRTGTMLKPTASRRRRFYQANLTTLERRRLARRMNARALGDAIDTQAAADAQAQKAANEGVTKKDLQERAAIAKKRVQVEKAAAKHNANVVAIENSIKGVKNQIESLKLQIRKHGRLPGAGMMVRSLAGKLHAREVYLRGLQVKAREQAVVTQKAAMAAGVLEQASKLKKSADRKAVVAAADTILKTPEKVPEPKRNMPSPAPGIPQYSQLAVKKLIVDEIISRKGKVPDTLKTVPGMGLQAVKGPMASTAQIVRIFNQNRAYYETDPTSIFGDFVARTQPSGGLARVRGYGRTAREVQMSEDQWVGAIMSGLGGFGALDGFWSDVGSDLKESWTDFGKQTVKNVTESTQSFVSRQVESAGGSVRDAFTTATKDIKIDPKVVSSAISNGINAAVSKLGGSASSSDYLSPTTEKQALTDAMGPGADAKFLGLPTWVYPITAIIGVTGYIAWRTTHPKRS